MSPSRRGMTIGLGLLLIVAMALGCSAPARILGELPVATLVGQLPVATLVGQLPGGAEGEPGAGPLPLETAEAEPLVVTHQGSSFHLYSLDGSLVDTRPADGLEYARPNTAQVVGESIYYVDSGGSSLGGVVRRVTAEGTEILDFTAAEPMQSLTFAVSADEGRIAWTHSGFEATGAVSQLWIANLDGTDVQSVMQSDPADDIDEYFALEAVRWVGDDLIYAWQVTGIGGYILFFGWSSFYRYSPSDGNTTALIDASSEATGPCWYALSPDAAHAVGGCGGGGMRERQVPGGGETAFPTLPNQGQQGGASYSPSGARLAYAIARGNPDDEAGQVVVRLNRGEEPLVLSTQEPGYFERTLWVDEERLVVGYSDQDSSAVDLLTVDGTRTAIGDGRLIGLLQPAPIAGVGPGLADQVRRGELKVVGTTANGDISGPGIRVVVSNPSPRDVTAVIPCGFTFEPDDAGDQRLMVVQEARAVVPAGGEAELTVYVVCIDASKSIPSDGAAYRLGSSASGDLLRLAQCACREDLTGEAKSLDRMGVLITGWMLGEDLKLEELQQVGGEGALGEMVGQGLGDLLGMLGTISTDWFDRCDLPRP